MYKFNDLVSYLVIPPVGLIFLIIKIYIKKNSTCKWLTVSFSVKCFVLLSPCETYNRYFTATMSCSFHNNNCMPIYNYTLLLWLT